MNPCELLSLISLKVQPALPAASCLRASLGEDSLQPAVAILSHTPRLCTPAIDTGEHGLAPQNTTPLSPQRGACCARGPAAPCLSLNSPAAPAPSLLTLTPSFFHYFFTFFTKEAISLASFKQARPFAGRQRSAVSPVPWVVESSLQEGYTFFIARTPLPS